MLNLIERGRPVNNKRIVIASSNMGKISEVKEILSDYEILSLSEVENDTNKKIIVTESQDTFVLNALEKVDCLYKQLGDDYIYIADDSGITIDILDGFPGVNTARWLDASDHEKNIELLKKVGNVSKEKRGCHYINAIALKTKEFTKTFVYTLDGRLSFEPRGKNGFGFDEIFELLNGKTLAELSKRKKLEISPRRKTLEMMKKYLNSKNL